MKKYIFLPLIILILAVSIFVSCKTTDTKDEVDAALTKVEEARQRAIDFESPEYFPSDWEELEARFEAAIDIAAYNALAEAYDELFRKTIPLYAQAREDEVCAIREQLISSGFADIFPQFLKNADDMALEAMKQYEAEQYYEAKETFTQAMAEYETLLMGAHVFSARQEIMDRGFTQFDADNFLRADEVAQAAIDAYEAGDKEGAIASAEEAMLRYNIVLANGWVTYAAVRRTAAVEERDLALAERANIASRENFREAEAIFNRAEENLAEENFNAAGLAFVEAEAMYAIARKDTEERRLRAEEAIRQAEEKIEESTEAAAGAERIIEGGSR